MTQSTVVRAGNLRRRVTFQSRIVTKDTFGQQVTSWLDTLTNVPADIQALTGRELIAAQAVNATITHQIDIRYSRTLADPVKTAAMRMVYVNSGVTRYFNPTSAINVDERNKLISIMASEGLSNQ